MEIKSKRLVPVLLFALLIGVLDISSVHAFHYGGVGACDSCHSMHDARDKDALAGNKSKSLLLATDPSSVCLNCHAGVGGNSLASVYSPDGSAMTPGGDFYWLTRTFSWSGGSSPADSHGHNVVALDYNLGEDLRLTQSPGGNYQSVDLGCTSCHDPHGRTRGGTGNASPPVSVSGSYGQVPAAGTLRGNYRLLGGLNYGGGEAAEGFNFSYDAPTARQNINNRFGESDSSHVDYGSGMSEWCGNCHSGILQSDHTTGAGGFQHQAGSSRTLTSETVAMYNTYINTGDLLAFGPDTGTGDTGTAYLQFVPFERGTNDPQSLNPTSTQGTNTNSRVMCLTCHRAHASAFQSIGRWDFDAALLAESHPRSGDAGASDNDVYHSYYDRNIAVEFGSEQGPFCEKCHGLDLNQGALGTNQEPMFIESINGLPDSGGVPIPDPLLQDPFQP